RAGALPARQRRPRRAARHRRARGRSLRPRHQHAGPAAERGPGGDRGGAHVIEILIGAILVYYVCLHGLYALLIALGATQLRRYQMGVTFGEYRRIAESPLTMPISLVIPA